jgi:hypothetical protein
MYADAQICRREDGPSMPNTDGDYRRHSLVDCNWASWLVFREVVAEGAAEASGDGRACGINENRMAQAIAPVPSIELLQQSCDGPSTTRAGAQKASARKNRPAPVGMTDFRRAPPQKAHLFC